MQKFARNILGTAITAGIMLALTSVSADAAPLKCKLDGTFFPPSVEGGGADVLTTALGSCKKLGKSTHTGILNAGTTPDGNGCVVLTTTEPMVAFNKKGDSITYTVAGTQCFKDANGQIPTTAGFCGAATDTTTSIIVATVTVTSGTGKKAGSTGSGALTGTVEHCNPDAPFGNFFHAEIEGTIEP